MRVGVEGARAAAWETVRVQIETKRVWDTEQAWDTEQCGAPREAGVRRGHPDASPRPDVRALAFPFTKCIDL